MILALLGRPPYIGRYYIIIYHRNPCHRIYCSDSISHVRVCVDGKAPSMVFEYMKYGDLAALLQSNDPLSGITPKAKLTQVFLITILNIKSQDITYVHTTVTG